MHPSRCSQHPHAKLQLLPRERRGSGSSPCPGDTILMGTGIPVGPHQPWQGAGLNYGPSMCLSFGFWDGAKPPQLVKEQLVRGLLLGGWCCFPGWLCLQPSWRPRAGGTRAAPPALSVLGVSPQRPPHAPLLGPAQAPRPLPPWPLAEGLSPSLSSSAPGSFSLSHFLPYNFPFSDTLANETGSGRSHLGFCAALVCVGASPQRVPAAIK